MLRKKIAQPTTVSILLFLQFIPLLLFPPSIFSASSQQWWLPVILLILTLFAAVNISIQRSNELYPWDLISFSHGFNIISRLMMLMPHATNNIGGKEIADIPYLITNILAIIISAGYIIFTELPDVRLSQLERKKSVS